MTRLLRSWYRLALSGTTTLFTLLAAPVAQAQCPVNASCTPGRASSPLAASFGMGILNVTLGTINNTTAGYADGYRDYSCTISASLTVGQASPISVRTSSGPEAVKVYIDYNNDGIFADTNVPSTTELVYLDQNLTGSTTGLHTGTFTPPTRAVTGTRLRMRVAADYSLGTLPGPCTTPLYSQTEDYGVTFSANVSPPAAAFTTSGTTTCTGCVQFTDASQNVPTAWLWNFGNGQTSTQQSPNYCYPTAGTYTVTLQATNAAGTTTSAATTITYNNAAPLAASCSPTTTAFFANYGVTRFRLGSIDNSSADGSASYQDFSCAQQTQLTVGTSYPMTITTGGTNAHDIRIYLDKDNNGTLTATELVYQSLNTATPGASTTLNLAAAGLTLNQPLRLRVVADAVGSPFGPCINPTAGQAEDYTVIARPNLNPPVAAFTSTYVAGNCVNPVQFTDQSNNAPTSWLWNFGDGQTDTRQNPSHQYTTAGTYTVSLRATNANGFNTVTNTNYLTISIPCFNYCPANGVGTAFSITSVGISNATPAFVNTSNANGITTPGGYTLYASNPISVRIGTQTALTVLTNLAVPHRVSVWVDFNLNGVFDTSEMVADGMTAMPNPASFTATFPVPAAAMTGNTRMRVIAQVTGNTTIPVCGVNLANGEVEDYLFRVLPLATRQELALPALALYPNPTANGHLTLRLPDANASGLYTTEVQNMLGATVLSTSLRLGPATDAELNLSALPAGVYVLRLRDAQGQTAVRRVVRE